MDTSEIPLMPADPGSPCVARPGWVTVAVVGEIDLATAPDVLATLLAASKSKTAGIVVDVSGVTFFGAAGIGAVLRARNHERDHGRDLVLRAPPPIVTRVLGICDLTDLVEPPATAPATGSATWRPASVALDGVRSKNRRLG